MMRIGAGFAILPTLAFIFVACSGEVEVTREVPTTVEVTREVPATVEVTREVPATVEVTREVPVTVEVARVTPDTPPKVVGLSWSETAAGCSAPAATMCLASAIWTPTETTLGST